MKKFTKILIAAGLMLVSVLPAAAQFHFGVKAGVAVNELKFDMDNFSASNRAGFVGGVMTEFTVPIIGVGFDASVMYATRSMEYLNGTETKSKTQGFIDIPVNFKWKFGIPFLGQVVKPFLTTGPDFSFLCSKKNIEDFVKNKSFDFAWNFGAGLSIVDRVQLAASYGFPIGRQASYDAGNAGLVHGKNRCWTITVAYFFK